MTELDADLDAASLAEHRSARFVRIFAVLGLVAVLAGAFGAHALDGRMSDKQLETWKTGAPYHLVHAVAGLAVALAGVARRDLGRAALTACEPGDAIKIVPF